MRTWFALINFLKTKICLQNAPCLTVECCFTSNAEIPAVCPDSSRLGRKYRHLLGYEGQISMCTATWEPSERPPSSFFPSHPSPTSLLPAQPLPSPPPAHRPRHRERRNIECISITVCLNVWSHLCGEISPVPLLYPIPHSFTHLHPALPRL